MRLRLPFLGRRSEAPAIEVRPPTLGAVLSFYHALGAYEGEDLADALAGMDVETAGAVLDAVAVEPGRTYTTPEAFVETARVYADVFLSRMGREQKRAFRGVDVVRQSCHVVFEGSDTPEPASLERALGKMPKGEAAMLLDASFGDALRLMGWGAVQHEIDRQLAGD